MGVPAIACVEFRQLFQCVDAAVPNRYLVAGELIDPCDAGRPGEEGGLTMKTDPMDYVVGPTR